jgi:hypothetical protein
MLLQDHHEILTSLEERKAVHCEHDEPFLSSNLALYKHSIVLEFTKAFLGCIAPSRSYDRVLQTAGLYLKLRKWRPCQAYHQGWTVFRQGGAFFNSYCVFIWQVAGRGSRMPDISSALRPQYSRVWSKTTCPSWKDGLHPGFELSLLLPRYPDGVEINYDKLTAIRKAMVANVTNLESNSTQWFLRPNSHAVSSRPRCFNVLKDTC